MKTRGKLWLFIFGVLVCGCPEKTPPVEAPPEAFEAPEDDSNADLETRCFDGDLAACDELGH